MIRPGRTTVITVQVEVLDGGRVRLSTPHARGWAAVAATPAELIAGLRGAFLEVDVASYARFRNRPYDLDVLTERVPDDPLAGSPGQRVRRVRLHLPELWCRMEDGRWRSPSGRVYRGESRAVQRVIEKRVRLGLPVD